MGTLFSLLGIARDATIAMQGALSSTGRNVANAQTPGYARRVAQLETARGSEGGVVFAGASRQADRLAQRSLLTEHGRKGAADSRADALLNVQTVLAPGDDDVAQALGALASSFTQLASNPADLGVRSSVLAAAKNFASRLDSAVLGVVDERAALFDRASAAAAATNDDLAMVGSLNRNIKETLARGQDASDLIDRRDLATARIAENIGGSVLVGDDGQATVLAFGTVLVNGGEARRLDVARSPADTLVFSVQHADGSRTDVTSKADEGRLGGIRESRDTDLVGFASTLDAFSRDTARAFNVIHSSGYGLDGVTNRLLFNVSTSGRLTLDSALDGHPERLAASSTGGALPAGNDVALGLSKVVDTPLPTGGTPASRFGDLLSALGAQIVNARTEQDFRGNTLASAQSRVQQVSGVSIEEEMSHLSMYQHAFEAQTRVLRVVDELLADILRIK
jgi:flagellar hook-associated protein 1 FlgK